VACVDKPRDPPPPPPPPLLARWLVTAGMTAFYMFRLLFFFFFFPRLSDISRADEQVEKTHHEERDDAASAHDARQTTLIGGWIGWPTVAGGDARFEKFLEPYCRAVGRDGSGGSRPAWAGHEYV